MIDFPEWQRYAECFGLAEQSPSLYAAFWSDNAAEQARAKALCAGCRVREACLEYAIAEGIVHGVWGGEGRRGRERIVLRRKGREPRPDTRKRRPKPKPDAAA